MAALQTAPEMTLFKNVRRSIGQGSRFLWSGAPCQVDGVVDLGLDFCEMDCAQQTPSVDSSLALTKAGRQKKIPLCTAVPNFILDTGMLPQRLRFLLQGASSMCNEVDGRPMNKENRPTLGLVASEQSQVVKKVHLNVA